MVKNIYRFYSDATKEMYDVELMNSGDRDNTIYIPDYVPSEYGGTRVQRESDGHLMRFTGALCKEGNKVFAGDVVNIHIFILSHDPDTLGVFEDEHEFLQVEIKHGNAYETEFYVESFYFEYEDEIVLLASLSLHEESFEILGNIHENPELLEAD